MTAEKDDCTALARHAINQRILASISPLPPPEEVFADWLLSVPHGASLEVAARKQIALIDRRKSLHPDVLHLRTLLVAVAGDCSWRKPTANL
jgi:hypothetical protein